MTSFDKKPVKKVVAVTVVNGKRTDNGKRQKTDHSNVSHHRRPVIKVTIGLVIRLGLKVAQHILHQIVQYFSELASNCVCGCMELVIVILSSVFFASKLICTTEPQPKAKKDIIKPEFLELIEDNRHPHHHHHQFSSQHRHQQKLQAIEEVVECCHKVEHVEPVIFEKVLPHQEPVTVESVQSVECEYYGIIKQDEPVVTDDAKIVRAVRPKPKLIRRLSNVERFYLENPRKGLKKEKTSTNLLLSIVYMSCAFVLTQFYLLITALLSTTLPSGLLFLITSLFGVATIVLQMVFPGKRQTAKTPKKQKSHPKTKECSVQTVNTISLDTTAVNKKPTQAVRPFILRRISSKDLWKICRPAERIVEKPELEKSRI
jgi:uncharacterized membrane protein required for colicin V production